jgi:hypothetical protein
MSFIDSGIGADRRAIFMGFSKVVELCCFLINPI